MTNQTKTLIFVAGEDVQPTNIVRVISCIDIFIVKSFDNDAIQRHNWSHGAQGVSVVAPCGSVSGCVQRLCPLTCTEQHMQQVALRISSEKYVDQFSLHLFKENYVWSNYAT